MKTFLLSVVCGLILSAATPAAAQCSCSSPPCSCRCTAACCICGCGVGNCMCKCVRAASVSISSGTTVNSAAAAISAATGDHIVVLMGGDQIVSSDIRISPWQALARLGMLPGVKLGISLPSTGKPDLMSGQLEVKPSETQIEEFRRLPAAETISFCVSKQAGLAAALDSLSRISGYAFDVYGTPAASFSLTAKGTLEETLMKLSAAAGVGIAVAQ